MRASLAFLFVALVLAVAPSLCALSELLSFISSSTVEMSPVLQVSAGETVLIELPEVRRHDRVYVVIDGRVNIDDISISPVEAFQLPLRVEAFEHDVFPTLISEKRYMFVVSEDSKKAFLRLRLQPLTPYIIKNVEGLQEYRVLGDCGENLICFELSPVRFHVNNYTQILLIHPYKSAAEPDFKVSGAVKLVRGRVSYVNIIVMTERDWYAYKVIDPFTPPGTTVLFEIDAYAVDIAGRRGEFLGENLVAIAIGVGISRTLHEEGSSPVVGVGELVIRNGGSTYRVEPTVQSLYTFNPRVYVLRKFRPSGNYLVSVISLTAFFVSLALLAMRAAKGDPGWI